MTEDEQTAEAVAIASRVAAFDQEQAEFGAEAAKIGLFWRTLKEHGVPDDIAGPLTINAQVDYYNGRSDDDDDDDDR